VSKNECKYNPGVLCGLSKCPPRCGWKPEVEAQRKKLLREKGRERAGKHETKKGRTVK